MVEQRHDAPSPLSDDPHDGEPAQPAPGIREWPDPDASNDDRPDTPTDLEARSWSGAVRRTVRQSKLDNITDLAAGLTYYAVLSILPLLLAVLSVLGLIGPSATEALLDNLRDLTPGPARDTVMGAIENLQRSRGTAGVLLIVGVGAAVWSASRYVAGFMRASNIVYGVDEGRPFWKKLPVRLGLTIVQMVALVVSTAAVVITGDLARQLGNLVGLESVTVTVWNIAKWPVAALALVFLLALLYWAGPNVQHPGFRWLTPGSTLAVVCWLAGSAAFALYVANFGAYNETYGALGGAIVFLVWLWMVNLAVLMGVELDAELARARQIEGGQSPAHEPVLPPQDTAKLGRGP